MVANNKEIPLVTIIMPVYNGMPYVFEAIDSLLAQTYPNIELIVINDASTDDSREQLQRYSDQITLLSNEKNLGIYATMNRGIDIANGEFVAFYHADDIYLPTIVEKEVEFLNMHPDAGAVFCSDIFVDRDNNEYGRLELPAEVRGGNPLDFKTIINAELTNKNIFLVCPTCMIRKSIFSRIGNFNQNIYKNSADLEMYMRISRSYSIGILEDYLIRYRHGHGNSSQKYHHLRTEPHRFFMIMDDMLKAGALEVASATALLHFDAHRQQEYILSAVSAYIQKDIELARALLRKTRLRILLQSNKIQRIRMTFLLLALRFLSRLPFSRTIADVFLNRWHRK